MTAPSRLALRSAGELLHDGQWRRSSRARTMRDPAWWMVLPEGKPVFLAGVSAERLAIALDPLPDSAPAVVRLAPTMVRSFTHEVGWLLDELDRAAIALFPQWMPGAEEFDHPSPTSLSAVRALATKVAARSPHFGPFLERLAIRAFQAQHGEAEAPAAASFSAEIRAAGLVRVIASSYGRDSVALLIDVPRNLTTAEQRALAAAARWICEHGHASVWLTGDRLAAVDTIPSVAITLPEHTPWVAEEEQTALPPARGAYPAISGQPCADSPAEQALELALKHRAWAHDRRWNHTIQFNAIAQPYRLDLLWESERLVVEVDGDDHRGRLKYADDRVRDVQLALLGYQVARFTNEHVLADIAAVVAQIEQLLFNRRGERTNIERHDHVQD